MKKRSFLTLLLALSIAVLTAGCGANEEADTGGAKDSIIIGQSQDATTLDAQMYSDGGTENICLNIYEPVVRVNTEGQVVEGAAESWDISEDGKEYVFNIRQGMKFHNGEDVKASDVKFTIERCKESPYVGTYFSYIDSVEVVDDSKVKVTLEYAYSSFLPLLGSYGGVVSEAVVNADENVLARDPIGSGPYKFVEWSQGNKIVLEAFEDYHLGLAPIKDLTFKVIGDESTATIALEKGEIDAYIGISAADRETVMGNDDLELSEVGSYIFRFLGINTEVEPFNNVKVRQAISYALDKEGLIIGAEEGVGLVADSHIPEGIVGYSEDFQAFDYNVEKAKDLLAEAGYEDGFTCTLTTTESRTMHAQIIQSDLKEIGIDVDIELYESGRFYEILEEGDFELQVLGWYYISPDPDVAVYDLYKSDAVLTGNYGRYSNEEMDELLERGRVSVNEEERQEIYERIEEIARDDAFNIPLYWRSVNIGYNKDLKGVVASPKLTYFVYDFSW